MVEERLRTASERPQSKLQENTDAYSGSVLSEAADYCPTPPLRDCNTDSPPLYIVGDTSASSPIPFHHVENIIQAAGYALQLGFPLYHHLTIHWPTGNWNHHGDILRAIAEWQRYHVGHPIFVWAKEANGGAHSHILLHLPRHKSKALRKSIAKQLKKLTVLRSLPTGTIQCRRISSHGDPFQHMRNRLAYILKRADENTRQMLGVGKRDFGEIDGKRVGMSQSLNVAARQKAGSVLPSGHRQCPDLIKKRAPTPLEVPPDAMVPLSSSQN